MTNRGRDLVLGVALRMTGWMSMNPEPVSSKMSIAALISWSYNSIESTLSHKHKTHQTRRSSQTSKGPSHQQRSLSSSSDERKTDQAVGSDKGSIASKCSKPTHWDVRPLIPLMQPRCDVTMEMRPGGSVSGLAAHQPILNAERERQQGDIRDHQKEEERRR